MDLIPVTAATLNAVMEFERVIQVHADGSVTTVGNVIWAPDLYDGDLSGDGWELMTGYSGQHAYNGPIMHNSEFIGGRMAEDILSTPGVYVALVNGTLSDDEPEGWAVARRVSSDPAA